MYHGKHIRKSKRPVALLASLVMLLAVAVVGTAAFLTTSKGPVTNTFTPAHVPNKVVEDFNGSTKSNVAIKNEGDVPAYIRVALVATWVKENGQGGYDVYGEQPVPGTDYTVSPAQPTNGWAKSGDYYYYTAKVPAKDQDDSTDKEYTGVLFSEIKPLADATTGKTPNQPDGYSLSIEILSQSIQADGTDEKGNKPIELAWGVDIVDGNVVAASIEQ